MKDFLSSLPGPMQLNQSLLYIAVIFLVLMVVLNTLVFKPLMKENHRDVEQ